MPQVRRPTNRGGRRAPPPPPPVKPYVARLAMLRAHSDVAARSAGRGAANWMASAAVYLGAAIAGAVWIGGSLFDLREAASAMVDRVAVTAGFSAQVSIEDVATRGALAGPRYEEARAAVLPQGRDSLVAATPQDIRARLRALEWVDDALVQRQWPNQVKVLIKRRAQDVALSAQREGA